MSSNAKYLFVALLLVVGVIGVSFYSCDKEEIYPNETSPVADPAELVPSADNTIRTDLPTGPDFVMIENTCGDPEDHLFHFESGERVGGLRISNDGRNLYFQFGYDARFHLEKTYMHIAFNEEDIPMDKAGNPDVESFEYQSSYSSANTNIHLVKIPLSQIDSDKECLIAFAADIMSKDDKPDLFRVWAGESAFGTSGKARIMKYTIEACPIDNAVGNNPEQ